ncbi:MAG: hypothetical protein K2J82_10425 [Muribaculaceae bacterium]|nr:hypothetical protein [Muribaculaceae bacterium]
MKTGKVFACHDVVGTQAESVLRLGAVVLPRILYALSQGCGRGVTTVISHYSRCFALSRWVRATAT